MSISTIDWKLRSSEDWKRRIIQMRWPGLLKGKLHPRPQYWWYLIPFDRPRRYSDMAVIMGNFYMRGFDEIVATLRREIQDADGEDSEEAILRLIEERFVSREAHYEYTEARGKRVFVVVCDPDVPPIGFTLDGQYCPLYAVVLDETRVGVETTPGESTTFVNFFLMSRMGPRTGAYMGTRGMEVGLLKVGETIIAPDGGGAGHTRLGDMMEVNGPTTLHTADIVPVTNPGSVFEQPPKTAWDKYGWLITGAAIGLFMLLCIGIVHLYL